MKFLPAHVTGATAADPATFQHHPAVPVAATSAVAGRAGLLLPQWPPSFNDLRQAVTPTASPARSPAGVATAAGVAGQAALALAGAPGAAQASPPHHSTAVPGAALLSGLLLCLFGLLLRRFARPQRRPLLIGARLPKMGNAVHQPTAATATVPSHPHHDAPHGLRAT